MIRWLKRIVSVCCRPLSRHVGLSSGVLGGEDYPVLWDRDLKKHSCGEFSCAMAQAKQVCLDYSHVEPGRQGTFVGVYDGHSRLDASRFACDNLSRHLITLAREKGTIDEEVLNNAFAATEDGFLSIVERDFHGDPGIASTGCCCLVGVIWKRTLYVANLGDCRAVLGHIGRFNRILAEQLTNDHNVRIKEVRDELRALHPDNPNIVSRVGGTWHVKGIIKVTRAIGDAFLKKPEFALGAEPLRGTVIRSDPSVRSRNLQPCDRFVIFASAGLWDLLSNEEAVQIVHTYPRQGIARRLVLLAMNVAVRARKKYDDLMNHDKYVRRALHDDITVVVIFIDHEMLNDELTVPGMSVQGFVDTHRPSHFNIEQEVATESSVTETEPTEPTETELSETESTGTEPIETEHTETELTENEPTDPTETESSETESTGTEPTEIEHTETETHRDRNHRD